MLQGRRCDQVLDALSVLLHEVCVSLGSKFAGAASLRSNHQVDARGCLWRGTTFEAARRAGSHDGSYLSISLIWPGPSKSRTAQLGFNSRGSRTARSRLDPPGFGVYDNGALPSRIMLDFWRFPVNRELVPKLTPHHCYCCLGTSVPQPCLPATLGTSKEGRVP